MAPDMSPGSEDDMFSQFLEDLPPAFLALSVPGLLLYCCLYAFVRRWKAAFVGASVPTLLLFWASPYVAPVRCAAFRALLNFAVAVGTMKLLDIHALSMTNSIPQYTAGPPLRPSLHALILLTELRYESFTPNTIRHPPPPKYPFPASPSMRIAFYREGTQFLIHLAIFWMLQWTPQYPPIKSLGILFAIYLIWTAIQLTVRYRNSPPLFGPIYLIDGLATFWTETWHNAFAAPCLSLAYTPVLRLLTALGCPRPLARSAAVVASFCLMAAFHVYALAPLLSDEGRRRIAVFFVANGIATVTETAVWGKKRHWARALLGWGFELALASWTVQAVEVAEGVLGNDWRGLCKGRSGLRG
ncbi:hypothetical protein BCR34DRAFT_487338 [Clohesyomyces aquaticus]|uniref:Wax synthase domain-containing protein n=1 Tax=Clohesyomyces aquaticus TaxID=1231657 RepID=A0A1Y1ZHF2_9PLEO|nr:hypothetical protein BCR34DRAFT_487338 [Clohesyomyces aquaticus]